MGAHAEAEGYSASDGSGAQVRSGPFLRREQAGRTAQEEVGRMSPSPVTKSINRPDVRPSSDNSEIPPGWDYNPATWAQRIPILALAAIGFILAAYLALYQYRII